MAFSSFRRKFKTQCAFWLEAAGGKEGWLSEAIREIAKQDPAGDYPIENPIVYNEALDHIDETSEIRLIVVGDNPGKSEQLDSNRRYLVGQAGKLGEGFFKKNPELDIDFRKNVIILNKTPIHTAKTKQLANLVAQSGERFMRLFVETQEWMAAETAALQQSLSCDLWLVGYGELKASGLFSRYAEALRRETKDINFDAADRVFVFQHFSMNRFSIDLKERRDPARSLSDNLREIGQTHRHEVLGW